MLKELKFVQGALSKKDLVPAMKHFVIEHGRIRSYNGMVALSSPIPFDLNCNPNGEHLYRAIENCEETVSLSLTPGGKLSVKSGKFRTLVPCIEESHAHPTPEGDKIEVDGAKLLKVFKVMEPIIGDDASRPWQAGILLKGCSAYATCNVVLVEYWMGQDFGHVVNIPGLAVREVIRINEPPTHVQCTDKSFTFHFNDGRWIRSQLLPTEWPDIEKILNNFDPNTAQPVDKDIFEALTTLRRFTDKQNRVFFEPGRAYTHPDENEGTSYEMQGSLMSGVYNWEMLKLLDGLATHADFSFVGKPCPFYGDMLRGVIIGMRA